MKNDLILFFLGPFTSPAIFLCSLTSALFGWFTGLNVIFHVYLLLVVLDIVASLIIDIGPGGAGLSSAKLWHAFRTHSISIIILLAAAILGLYISIPAAQWIAGAMAFKEGVALAEYAALFGVLPEPYNQILEIFRNKLPVPPEKSGIYGGKPEK